jgi:hypothetical protein
MGFHQGENKNIIFKRVIGGIDKLPAVQAGQNRGEISVWKE